jgi:hypothetical protein
MDIHFINYAKHPCSSGEKVLKSGNFFETMQVIDTN